MVSIAILDCASLPASLEHHHSVGQLVTNWLTPHLPEAAHLVTIPIAQGAVFPKISGFDAFILPGSEYGVYEDPPWMGPLRDYLLAIRASGKPLLGICFGHQMMAHTFGGRAEKLALGMCTGAACWNVGSKSFDAHILHQDQVVELPPGAQALGSADYCPNGIIAYDFAALSFQFHPEYTAGFMQDVVALFEGEILSDEETAAARASLKSQIAADLFGAQVAQFLLGGASALKKITLVMSQ